MTREKTDWAGRATLRAIPERPEIQTGTVWITGSRIGAVLAIGLGMMLYVELPETRSFILGASALGAVVGLALWLRHR